MHPSRFITVSSVLMQTGHIGWMDRWVDWID